MISGIERDEKLLRLHQMALAEGRRLQSAETGFVHIKDTIPILQNMLFALALLRSKTADAASEAKELLGRLLHFQAENGNFPTYLHQYPSTNDFFFAAELLAPLHWILRDFGSVLGAQKEGIEACLGRIKKHLNSQEVAPQGAQRVKIEAINGSLKQESFKSPELLGEYLIACQLAGEALPATPWDSTACAYNGEAAQEKQMGFEPEVTLYDLFMAYRTGTFSSRVLKSDPIHLYASLIRPVKGQAPPSPQEELTCHESVPENRLRWYHRFKKVWGTPDRTHTFVCQGGNISDWSFEGDHFHFVLGDPIENDHRDHQREISFFLDRQPMRPLVGGAEATTFRPDDEVKLILEGKEITLKFSIVEGEGEFMGHIMRGNRPSQIAPERFEAYDWQIFLRTIRRSERCCVKVFLHFS